MRISELFAAGKPVFSFEFFPPKTEKGDVNLRRTIAELRPLSPGFVSVTYGAGGTTRDRTLELANHVKHDVGLEAMAHLTCVGASRSEIGAILDRLEEDGIENLIALRGDPPKGESGFVPHPDGLAHASELVAMIREQNRPFCVAGACYPEKHVEAPTLETDLENLVVKVKAGVDVLITQLFYDNTFYFSFVEKARAAGIEVPVVPGIMPITNLTQAERFGATIPQKLRERLEGYAEDDEGAAQVGTEYAIEQCRELLERDAPGIHFYTLNKSRSTRDILYRLREDGIR